MYSRQQELEAAAMARERTLETIRELTERGETDAMNGGVPMARLREEIDATPGAIKAHVSRLRDEGRVRKVQGRGPEYVRPSYLPVADGDCDDGDDCGDHGDGSSDGDSDRDAATGRDQDSGRVLRADGGHPPGENAGLGSFGVDVPDPDPDSEREREAGPGGGRARDTSDDYKFSRPQCRAITAAGDRCSNPVQRSDGASFCPRHAEMDVETIDERRSQSGDDPDGGDSTDG